MKDFYEVRKEAEDAVYAFLDSLKVKDSYRYSVEVENFVSKIADVLTPDYEGIAEAMDSHKIEDADTLSCFLDALSETKETVEGQQTDREKLTDILISLKCNGVIE